MSIEKNINLPPALMSRFDLIFVLRDVPDKDNDLRLAQHILHVHRFMKEPETEHEPFDVELLRYGEFGDLLKLGQGVVIYLLCCAGLTSPRQRSMSRLFLKNSPTSLWKLMYRCAKMESTYDWIIVDVSAISSIHYHYPCVC